jgi:hypothetical protein
VVEQDSAPQRSPRRKILKLAYASDRYIRQAIEPFYTVVKRRAISAERGRGVPGHLSRPHRQSFAVGAFVQEAIPAIRSQMLPNLVIPCGEFDRALYRSRQPRPAHRRVLATTWKRCGQPSKLPCGIASHFAQLRHKASGYLM